MGSREAILGSLFTKGTMQQTRVGKWGAGDRTCSDYPQPQICLGLIPWSGHWIAVPDAKQENWAGVQSFQSCFKPCVLDSALFFSLGLHFLKCKMKNCTRNLLPSSSRGSSFTGTGRTWACSWRDWVQEPGLHVPYGSWARLFSISELQFLCL